MMQVRLTGETSLSKPETLDLEHKEQRQFIHRSKYGVILSNIGRWVEVSAADGLTLITASVFFVKYNYT